LVINSVAKVCTQKEIFNFTNSLSGGVDSSLIQVILKQLGFNSCYKAYYFTYGDQVKKYSSDVASYLNSYQRLVKTSTQDILRNIKDGIEHTELPYIFEGEWQQNQIYHAISLECSEPGKGIIVFDGSGADTIFGHGLNLILLKYLSIPWIKRIFIYLNKYLLKYISVQNYRYLRAILNSIELENFDSQSLSVLLKDYKMSELIQEAFNLKDISKIYALELEDLKKYNGPLIEKFYRLRIFEGPIWPTNRSQQFFSWSIRE